MNKVAVLMNTQSGKGQLAHYKKDIATILERNFAKVDVYDTTHFDDRVKAILQIAEQSELLIVAGGDGTVNEVVNIIAPLTNRPVLAIIPAGTANDFSRQIKMPQNPLEATQKIVALKKRLIDIGKSDQRYFLNIWGIGLVAQASESVEIESKQNVGKLAYYLHAIQSIGEERPFKLEIKVKDKVIEEQAVMVIVGNGSYTGGVRAFFPEADISDGLFEVLIIKEASIKSVWSILQSRKEIADYHHMEGVIAFQTNRLTISTDPAQKIDCDGEIDGQTPTHITLLPKHIEMIVGE
ncbi:diacylglycerol/lipid kinase family protein [Amphibacillus cookii]|uniref:diacylglycerol/lipid kinase family protein n=1 Tax=Amphibacillus cookii TaxID=767787 RepID=UPI001958CF12|nr:diacylglycerol kinase family protein [Amphibacillus cookii]MBM7541450.1 YegS/Rv2252/BmrU family lipid kinase [Amphibacillus cookii]